jgi:23S rRNA (adenine2503-C2)-methyltransferase
MEKVVIKGLDLAELESWISSIGEKPYRARQLYRWMYRRGARAFAEMTDLSREFRLKLEEIANLECSRIEMRQQSKLDQSIKYLFQLTDNLAVEAVYMVEGNRITVCLSTMIGCPIGCPYCATGIMGFKRNLTAGEIVDQFLWIQREQSQKITNVVLMGMGEPFLNYEAVVKAAAILNSELGAEIAARRITISTVGIVPQIYRYADEGQRYKLAISLNAVNDRQRNDLVPINQKYPLSELMKAINYYTRKSRRRVTFEYVLIKGVNDGSQHARELITLLSKIPCKLNIIPYNANEFLPYKAPGEKELDRFLNKIYQAPFAVTVRRSKGQDIAAACGQLYVRDQYLTED